MRRVSGLFAALALVVPFGVWAAAPADAARPLPPKCKTFTGTERWKPALPKLSSKKKVNSTVKLSAKLTGCTGVKGITRGTSSAITKLKKQNCTTTVAAASKGSKSTGVIKWNNGKKSKTSNVLTLKSKVGVSPATFKLVSKYKSGIGVGHTTTTTIRVTLNKGACLKTALSKATFHATKSTTK
jgi:hypothetical protein